MDLMDKWMGIRQIKGNHAPQPYHRRAHQSGEHVKMNDRASKAADYLGKVQWGRTPEEREACRPYIVGTGFGTEVGSLLGKGDMIQEGSLWKNSMRSSGR